MSNPDQSAVYSILIDIQAKLAELKAARAEFKQAREEGESLGSLFRTGLGIGGGMEIARRGVEFFREAIGRAVEGSSKLAAEIERADKRLGLSASGYQTLAKEARESQTDFQELLASENIFRQKIGEALLDPTKGNIFRQIGEDVQALSRMPLDQATERVAIGLGKIADANVRARMQQELFGRNAAAMTPVLERLRTQGLEPLKRSAEETGSVLSENMARSLNEAETAAQQAQQRLAVALAPMNLQLQQLKASGINFLANNAGRITSATESGFIATMAASLDKGLVAAAEKIEKSGGWKSAFSNLGKTLAGPIGVAIGAFLISYVVKEIERSKVEANNRSIDFANQAMSVPHAINQALPQVQSDQDVTALYNRAVVAYQKAVQERDGMKVVSNDEEMERYNALNDEIEALNKLIPLIKARGLAYVDANAAARVDFDNLARAQTDMIAVEANHANFQAENFHTQEQLRNRGIKASTTEEENRQEDLQYLQSKTQLLQIIYDLTAKLPINGAAGETDEKRAQELAKLQAQIQAANVQYHNENAPPSDFEDKKQQFKTFRSGKNSAGGDRLSASQGIGAGAIDYVTQLGTAGEQLAGTFSGLVANSVSTVADGIVGLITKTKSLGDVGRSMGMMFLQTFAQLAVQLLAQKALTLALTAAHVAGEGVKTTATVTGAGIRAGAAATETAVEHTSTLGKLANAAIGAMSAMASIPYVGPILAIAAAGAIIALGVKLMKREHGGPVKKGESYLVGEKRPEVFVPDQDGHIVPSVDQYRDRYTMPATSTTGGSYASSGASGAIAAGAARPTRFIHVQAPDLVSARRMAREPDFDNVMLDWSQRHRGEIVA